MRGGVRAVTDRLEADTLILFRMCPWATLKRLNHKSGLYPGILGVVWTSPEINCVGLGQVVKAVLGHGESREMFNGMDV